ncbi:hypothetical protein HED60_00150 [Planctomycetales bacterium ZRK34]|nr:hypothetical protein HED60_00150 [Planctomycetales bacterium ZRK34]
MPDPGQWWWHLIFHTLGSWLHGDPRGFRSRDHRIHSSGDYKNPPPSGEHDKLHRYHRRRSRVVKLAPNLYPSVGGAVRNKCDKSNRRVLAISVDATHVHALVQLPDDYEVVRRFAAGLKQASSHAVREVLPGRVWAGGGKPIRIRDRSHHRRVFAYILEHASEGAWVWREAET